MFSAGVNADVLFSVVLRFPKQGSASDVEALVADVASELKAGDHMQQMLPPQPPSPVATRALKRLASDPSRFVSSPTRTKA